MTGGLFPAEEVIFFHLTCHAHTGCEAHPASYPIRTGDFTWQRSWRSMRLTTQSDIVARLRINVALNTSSWRGAEAQRQFYLLLINLIRAAKTAACGCVQILDLFTILTIIDALPSLSLYRGGFSIIEKYNQIKKSIFDGNSSFGVHNARNWRSKRREEPR
jgi:hypothetical protein